MNTYHVRNLSLAVVDDDVEKQLAAPFKLVDLLDFPPCPGSRLSTLEGHCRNAAAVKKLSFDLCSIDMNFQADLCDPVRPDARIKEAGIADPASMTASGLYHGMALLARRNGTDEQGNSLPLAWEVRSATPHQFSSRADLRADAIRGFALLRSLLASPDPGETLEECLRRERRIVNPHATPLVDGSLMQMFENDLQKQDPSSGLVQEILKKLLPRWRRLFFNAVDDRKVNIHIPEMNCQLEKLCAAYIAGRRFKGNGRLNLMYSYPRERTKTKWPMELAWPRSWQISSPTEKSPPLQKAKRWKDKRIHSRSPTVCLTK